MPSASASCVRCVHGTKVVFMERLGVLRGCRKNNNTMIMKIKVGLVKTTRPLYTKRTAIVYTRDWICFPYHKRRQPWKTGCDRKRTVATHSSAPAVKFAISACKLCTLCAWNESRVYGTLGSLWVMQKKQQHDDREN